MEQKKISHIVVVGDGLAAHQMILALRVSLPKTIAITQIRNKSADNSDEMYGSVTSPEAYAANLVTNVEEPEILLNTSSTFSFGTYFQHLGQKQHSWMQCYHLPFHTEAGVSFHQFVIRHKAKLTDYLISAQAALMGKFAHPPHNNKSALSRAEYGYHFNPSEWSQLWAARISKENVQVINAEINSIALGENGIQHLCLSNNEQVGADLFIDCSGPSALLLSKLNSKFEALRQVFVRSQITECQQTGPAYRQLRFHSKGWQSKTPLQHSQLNFALNECDASDEIKQASREYTLGHRSVSWVDNCVAIGLATAVLEPVTNAPYILLTKDISRLLELLPISTDMKFERKEYNRRYMADLEHAELFHKALYHGQKEVGYTVCDKLTRKLAQFEHRGILVSYDFEPFNKEDWAILHAGVGRVSKMYDPLTNNVSEAEMATKLNTMQQGIAHLAKQMPPHHLYLEKFKQYLRDNHG